MRRVRYLISSLLAAGFGATGEASAETRRPHATGPEDDGRGKLFRIFKLDHLYSLMQHRSHRSHRSHSSHRSGAGGYGGYGGGYVPSAPVYTPPPAPPYRPPATPRVYAPSPSRSYDVPEPTGAEANPSGTAPSLGADTAPAPDPLRALSGRSELFASIVKRVQIGLMGQGYYEGAVDGIVGPGMRSSLTRFQTDLKLPVTGSITPETLDALRIAAR